MDRKIVIIPTYNEKENIENIIRAIFALEKKFHILVKGPLLCAIVEFLPKDCICASKCRVNTESIKPPCVV